MEPDQFSAYEQYGTKLRQAAPPDSEAAPKRLLHRKIPSSPRPHQP